MLKEMEEYMLSTALIFAGRAGVRMGIAKFCLYVCATLLTRSIVRLGSGFQPAVVVFSSKRYEYVCFAFSGIISQYEAVVIADVLLRLGPLGGLVTG